MLATINTNRHVLKTYRASLGSMGETERVSCVLHVILANIGMSHALDMMLEHVLHATPLKMPISSVREIIVRRVPMNVMLDILNIFLRAW